MKNNIQRGSFIVFEGIDGSGKSNQIHFLQERLTKERIKYYSTFEPTDSPIGSLIHQIMTGRVLSDNKVVAALFVADRLDHLLNPTNGIYSKIMDGISVISDRYYFSSYAYHSVDMPMEWIIAANSKSADILRPSVTVFIDVDPDDALKRIEKTRFHPELFETRERLVSAREKYFEAFERLKDLENILIVDGKKNERLLSEEIWNKIKRYFYKGKAPTESIVTINGGKYETLLDEKRIYRDAISVFGAESQVMMAFEEMAELQKELCKNYRGGNNVENIAEEIADVQIVLEQMKILFGCNEIVDKFKKMKLERLMDRIENTNPQHRKEKENGATD